jgi:hypothetical protein
MNKQASSAFQTANIQKFQNSFTAGKSITTFDLLSSCISTISESAWSKKLQAVALWACIFGLGIRSAEASPAPAPQNTTSLITLTGGQILPLIAPRHSDGRQGSRPYS